MSMISPETYADQYKDMSYEELLPIRDDLIRDIWNFEIILGLYANYTPF